MSTLTEARKAIAEQIRTTVPREANVLHYDAADEAAVNYPRIYVEIPTIDYDRTIGVCSKAEIEGRVIVEVDAANAESASDVLDEYLDPYSSLSVISALRAGALMIPSFGGAMESFVVRQSIRTGTGLAEIPFVMTTTRPAP